MNKVDDNTWPYNKADAKFVERTPSNGDAYYNAVEDVAIVSYRKYIKLYYNRKAGKKGITPSCFSDERRIEI